MAVKADLPRGPERHPRRPHSVDAMARKKLEASALGCVEAFGVPMFRRCDVTCFAHARRRFAQMEDAARLHRDLAADLHGTQQSASRAWWISIAYIRVSEHWRVCVLAEALVTWNCARRLG